MKPEIRDQCIRFSIYGLAIGYFVSAIYCFSFKSLPMGHSAQNEMSDIFLWIITPIVYLIGFPWSLIASFLLDLDPPFAPAIGLCINTTLIFALIGLIKSPNKK